MDSSARLSVPSDVLRAVDWWSGITVEVLAELVQAGLVRIYLADSARQQVARLISDLSELEIAPEARFERLQAVQDRYRPLKMYQDGRIRLTKEVTAILGFSLDQQPTLYVQSFLKGFEIMSLAFREQRLKDTAASTTIGLHLA